MGKKNKDILAVRKTLPIYEHFGRIGDLIDKHQIIILQGDTGSGKTTQIGHILRERGYCEKGVVAITQPRRVAAMSVAARVAEEMDTELGGLVGYLIRFEDMTGPETKIKFMTDGMLQREWMTDRSMDRYSVIVLDEAHERTTCTDVLFGLILRVLEQRPELKCVIASATLDTDKFCKFFKNAPLVSVSGRMYPVEVFYLASATSEYVQQAIDTAVNIHLYGEEGDVLIFLTGEEEIETAVFEIAQRCQSDRGKEAGKVTVMPLYSSLPPAQQRKIFTPCDGRKIVVATNIAETSVTIDGIVYVVDPGFTKQKVYNPRTQVESLLVAPVSKASAAQRAGRAGRTRPGKCFRLYTGMSHDDDLMDMTYPEILRTNLQNTVLTLMRCEVDDIVHFDFMDPPSPETLMRAIEALHYQGAVGHDFKLTPLGKRMANLPLEPPLAAMLLASGTEEYSCSEEILSIVSMLSVPPPLMRPRQSAKEADYAHRQFHASQEGDHVMLLNLYNAYVENGKTQDWCWGEFVHHRAMKSAESVRRQLSRELVKGGGELLSTPVGHAKFSERVRRALLKGLFMQAAIIDASGKCYVTLRDQQYVAIHPGSCLKHKPEMVVYSELTITEKSYMRQVTSVWTEWLLSAAPEYFESQEWPTRVTDVFTKTKKRLLAEETKPKKKKAKV